MSHHIEMQREKQHLTQGELKSNKHSSTDVVTQVIQCELDIHAHTCCWGKDCQVQYKSGQADVRGFLEELGELVETRIVSTILAYDNMETGETYLLTFHQVLRFPNMNNHLLNPNKKWDTGYMVNDTPLHYLKPSERVPTAHSLLSEDCSLHIPFCLDGIISF